MTGPATPTAPGLSEAPGRPTTPGDQWYRLHPLSPVVGAGRVVIALGVAVVPTALTGGRNGWGPVVEVIILAVVLLLGLVSWLMTRWRVEHGVLRIDSGLVRRSSRRFPVAQIQAIDTVRPALARVFGLAELRLRMGGSTRGSGRLAYLRLGEAEAVRAHLLALAHGVAGDAPAPPERVLVRIGAARLVASLLLSGTGVLLEGVIAGLVVLALISPAAAAGAIGAGTGLLLALLGGLWRRLNSGFHLTAAEAPDGLRLRSGLLETSNETIPRGRVQAVRMVEPLLWRPLGWCRLEVDVAGKQRRAGDNRSEGRALRSLLPVGSRLEAARLVERVLPGVPDATGRPPRRAWWKAPLRYRWMAWGANERYAATVNGRWCKTTDWVPLDKVQSVRRVQGPLQRRLGLATVHLDTAGRNIHAVLRDRSWDEASAVVEQLPGQCRVARGRPGARAQPWSAGGRPG